MSEQAAANFTCAAKAMGGAFTAVKSGTDLDRQLRQALEIAPNAKPAKAPVRPRSLVAIRTGDRQEPDTGAAPPCRPWRRGPPRSSRLSPKPNTVLSAVLASGTPPLEAGVTWEIYKINTTPTGQLRTAETPAWTAGGGQAKLKLPEGRYAVRAGLWLRHRGGHHHRKRGRRSRRPSRSMPAQLPLKRSRRETARRPRAFSSFCTAGRQRLRWKSLGGRASPRPSSM